MSGSHGNHGAPTQKIEPLRGVERLEWARVTLEEAVGRMVKNPDEKVYAVAVIARYRELQDIRIPVEERVEQLQRADQPPIQALVCPHCMRGVATLMQHFTGSVYMCARGYTGTKVRGE